MTARFFVHPNCTDVAIELLKSLYVKESRRPVKLKVRWWRLRRGQLAYSMNVEERLKLTKAQWMEWHHFSRSS